MHTYTRAEQHTINTGNIMLSQAGMPLMTDEQEWAFIQKQRTKNADLGAKIASYAIWAIPAYIAYRLLK